MERMSFDGWNLVPGDKSARSAWFFQEKLLLNMEKNMAEAICRGKENLRGQIEEVVEYVKKLEGINSQLVKELKELTDE